MFRFDRCDTLANLIVGRRIAFGGRLRDGGDQAFIQPLLFRRQVLVLAHEIGERSGSRRKTSGEFGHRIRRG